MPDHVSERDAIVGHHRLNECGAGGNLGTWVERDTIVRVDKFDPDGEIVDVIDSAPRAYARVPRLVRFMYEMLDRAIHVDKVVGGYAPIGIVRIRRGERLQSTFESAGRGVNHDAGNLLTTRRAEVRGWNPFAIWTRSHASPAVPTLYFPSDDSEARKSSPEPEG